LRTAIVHDWLTGMRGGERCLERILGLFPEADLFTLFHVEGATSAEIEARNIRVSGLSRLPGAARHYRKALPLFPAAISAFDLSGYDLVISSSHAVAKGVRSAPEQPHLCYCYTPMRYVWDQADAYLGRGARRALSAPLAAYLRRFDLRTSTPERVTRFVAISHCVAARIARHYGREAAVVHPPVELDRFTLGPPLAERDDFYLLVGGFVPYKREELALEAFASGPLASRRLVVVGDGPRRSQLERSAPPNADFRGRVSDEELADLLSGARALLHPQEEDFGITALEAQACGTPVIAYGAGGALDTVNPLVGGGEGRAAVQPRSPTGLYFSEPSGASLTSAVERFEKSISAFEPAAIREWAERFSPARFEAALRAEIDRMLAGRA
jgi:glycosyltransferase involved in cell wall biosynthesis